MIRGENNGWANDNFVDDENGNYDYLMYDDIDFKHPEVRENIYQWADWFIKITGVRGFRMDTVKHIDSRFMTDFIRYLMDTYGNDFYVFGEFWKADELIMKII